METKIFTRAEGLIRGARNQSYGHPLDNHSRTALLWSAYLGINLTPEQVCDLNILQKLSRGATGVPHEDNDVDAVGYFGNKEMIREERTRRQRFATLGVNTSTPRPSRPVLVTDISDLTQPKAAGGADQTLDWTEPPQKPA